MVGRNILIVDDEAPIREMIAVALEMAAMTAWKRKTPNRPTRSSSTANPT